jgi:competence protein ComEA
VTDFKELFRFSRAESIALTALIVLLCVGAGIRFYQRSSQSVPVQLYFENDLPESSTGRSAGPDTLSQKPVTAAPPTPLINVNTAPAESLLMLPGIGPVMSARIVAYRDSAGPFDSVAQLTDVPGIGPKTLEAIKERVKTR